MPEAEASGSRVVPREVVGVAIVGAGLSGIGAACHLRRECPDLSVVILEARERLGGTWDLFRYPGVRSDSDMHTLGYDFRPWEAAEAIADGPSILKYLRDTAESCGVERLIQYRSPVKRAIWRSAGQYWELHIENGDARRIQCARFIHMCAGYYRYDHGHQPEFPGRSRFRGQWIHPQHWPEDLDYAGKRVLVVGSGATAMTLVPSLADEAASVVMLQRSPTWVISRPRQDRLANLLRTVLPSRWAYAVTRWKNTRLGHWFYQRTRQRPEKVRAHLLKRARHELAGRGDIADFTPSYDPWDQRLCLVPDSDLFRALREGGARVVTAEIAEFTPRGVRLDDGRELEADIVVSATGLELQQMGGIEIQVDGEDFDFATAWSYRGMMLTGLPNLVAVFGYINASWTLRADLVSRWFCRLLEHMRRRGHTVVTPQLEPDRPPMEPRPWIDGFSAGYMRRVMHRYPRQGDREPWINSQDYLRERREFERMSFDEPALRYESRADESVAGKAA
jgi:cation diffusion facilitator CzcD-associated flavoprotein CzcO